MQTGFVPGYSDSPGRRSRAYNVVTISTNGSNGPWIYKGDDTGLNSKAAYGPAANAATNTKKSNIKFGYGNGILSKDVIGTTVAGVKTTVVSSAI